MIRHRLEGFFKKRRMYATAKVAWLKIADILSVSIEQAKKEHKISTRSPSWSKNEPVHFSNLEEVFGGIYRQTGLRASLVVVL